MEGEAWTTSSWRTKARGAHLPVYKSESDLKNAFDTLRSLPPLVHPKECDRLRDELGKAIDGKVFVLWGGDCAEDFTSCNSHGIESKFRVLLQMSLILIFEGQIPVVRIGRIAGQYGKPRSSETEKLADGTVVQTYKGDMVNSTSVSERDPSPQRMVEGYFRSAATLNYLRALCNGGAGSLHDAASWNLDQVLSPELKKSYNKTVSHIVNGVSFMDVIAGRSFSAVRDHVEIYASHEGLLLEYEEALTHPVDTNYYDLSAHLLWIGDRTRDPDGAHVHFFAGVSNPIACKVGPSMTKEAIVRLVTLLNPKKIPGRLTLISRMGVNKVEHALIPLVEAVRATGIPVLWVCDPCHGNTFASPSGVKTRRFEDLLAETLITMRLFQSIGMHLGGVHLELTGDHVTECVGGASELLEKDLHLMYASLCDPRLNYAQALDVAFRVAAQLRNQKKKPKK